MRHLPRLLLLLLLAAGAARAADDTAVALVVKWPLGRQLTTEISTSGRTTAGAPGVEHQATQSIAHVQRITATALPPPPGLSHRLQLHFDAIRMEMNNAMMRFKYDSDHPPADPDRSNPMIPMIEAMVGLELITDLDAGSRIVAVSGTEPFVERVGRQSAMSKALAAQTFNDDFFRQLCLLVIGVELPDHPIEPGATWRQHIANGAYGLGDSEINAANTFEGWQERQGRNCVRIVFSGSIDISQPTSGPLSRVKMHVTKGTVEGRFWFDPVLGQSVESDVDIIVEMDLVRPGPQGDVKTRSSTRQRTQTRLIEVKDP